MTSDIGENVLGRHASRLALENVTVDHGMALVRRTAGHHDVVDVATTVTSEEQEIIIMTRWNVGCGMWDVGFFERREFNPT